MKTPRSPLDRFWVVWIGAVGMLFLLLLIVVLYAGCQHSYSLDNYMAEMAGAEKRAGFFKENGQWTPNALRAYARQLRSGEVIAQGALAEAGVVILQDINVSTVRTALEAVAQRVENCK